MIIFNEKTNLNILESAREKDLPLSNLQSTCRLPFYLSNAQPQVSLTATGVNTPTIDFVSFLMLTYMKFSNFHNSDPQFFVRFRLNPPPFLSPPPPPTYFSAHFVFIHAFVILKGLNEGEITVIQQEK